MTRCLYPGCGGTLMAEPVESLYDRRQSGDTELVCLSCGRSPTPAPDFSPKSGQCVERGCGREDTGAGRCNRHRAAFERIGRRTG